MPTCPNCGEIVMNGDPYCSNCGTTFAWGYDDDDRDSRSYGGSSYNYTPPSDSSILLSKARRYKSYLEDARNESDPEKKIDKYKKAVDIGVEYRDFARKRNLEPIEIPDACSILETSDVDECGRIYQNYLKKYGIFTDYETIKEDCRYVLRKSGNSHVIGQKDSAHKKEMEEFRKQRRIEDERNSVIADRENYFKNLQKANNYVLKNSKSKAMKHYKKAIKCYDDYINGKWSVYDSEKSIMMPKPPEKLTDEAIYHILILYQRTHPLLTSSKKDLEINDEITSILSPLHTAELIEADNNVKEIIRQKQLKRQMQKEKVEDVITDGIVGARILGDKLLSRFKK